MSAKICMALDGCSLGEEPTIGRAGHSTASFAESRREKFISIRFRRQGSLGSYLIYFLHWWRARPELLLWECLRLKTITKVESRWRKNASVERVGSYTLGPLSKQWQKR